jgi:hypothetical protein
LGLLKIDLDALGLGHRKDDFNFLRAVIAVVASRLKTWRTWDFKAEEAKAEAEDKYQKALAKLDRTVYDRFCQFAAEAFDKGYGITRKLVKAVEQNDRKKQHTPVMKLLAQYPGLEETFAEQARTYQAGAYAARLPGRARMTICNRDSSPLALPFGMSTKGYKFSLVVEGQRITPTIRFWSGRGKTNDVILDCGASKYFRDPSISPLCGKKGTLEGYNIAFWRGGTKTATQGEHPSGHAT